MVLKIVSVVVTTLVVVLAATGIYLHFSSSPPKPAPATFSDLTAGTQFTITNNDQKMIGGGCIINFKTNGYYGVKYNLVLESNTILTGTWRSTGETLVWLMVDGVPYMSTPLPDATRGILNQTMVPGQYTLVIGGHPGDVISITKTIEIQSYIPQQIGNFSIPAGTHINSDSVYPLYLSLPGEMVGSFITPSGAYSYSLYNSTGIGFSVGCSNKSTQQSNVSFTLGPSYQFYGPGYYNLTFVGEFNVTQTLEFLYYYDYSII